MWRTLVQMTHGPKNTLRERLEDVFEAESWSEYLTLLAKVSSQFKNKIVLLDSPNPVERYTCVVHVLDFTEKPEFLAIDSRGFNVVIAGPNFLHWLLAKELLTEVAEPDACEGYLVLYFDQNGRIKHAGLTLGNGRVESKWGKGGLLQHDIFEVPASYGSNVRYFRRVQSDQALEYFKCYAKEKGMLFLDDFAISRTIGSSARVGPRLCEDQRQIRARVLEPETAGHVTRSTRG